jgi:hypothetical protein
MWVVHIGRFIILLHIASLIRISRCATVVANYWKNGDCEGPPASITSFNMKDTSAKAPINESWPDVFRYVTRSYYPIGSCTDGMAPHIGARKCCITYLNPDFDMRFSFSYDAVGLSNFSELIPTLTNGERYCSVQAINTKLPWYNVLYVRMGTCTEGFYCDTQGNVTVFNSGICRDYISKGHKNITITAAEAVTVSIKDRGNFTIQEFTFTNSTLEYAWKAYIPYADLVPEYRGELAEFLGAILSALSLLAILITIYFFGRRFTRNFMILDFCHAFGQLIWLGALIVNIMYIHSSSRDGFALMAAFSYGLKNFATLYSTMHSFSIVMVSAAVGRRKQLICYVSITALHVACAGSDYTHYWRVKYGTPLFSMETFNTWRNADFVWLLFSELSIFLPVLILLYTIVKKRDGGSAKNFGRSIMELTNVDNKFSALVILALVFIALFAILCIVDSLFVGLYGSERVCLACQLIRMCLQLLPFSLNCFIMWHLPQLLILLKRMDFIDYL